MPRQDIKLIDRGDYYDFDIVDGDIVSDESFETSLITCLLVDRRADSSEIVQPEKRRGWIGSIGNEYQLGSKLWLYAQSRMTNGITQSIQNELLLATKHYIDDGLVKDVKAVVIIEENRIGFEIFMLRFDSIVDTRYFELWNNTGD